MSRILEGKVAFITGGVSGIGLQLAKTFAHEGAKVAIADLSPDKCAEVASDISGEGFTAIAAPCDVTDEDAFKQSLHRVKATFRTIDILINNAGFQHVSPIEDFPTEKFEQLIKVMLTGPFIGIKHVFPIMKEQGYGRILNMASINGLVGFSGKAAYNSAKHGIIGLTKVAALEGAPHGITVNALCPGYVDTPLVQNQLADLAKTRNVSLEHVVEEVIFPLVPQKRLLSVSEIADYAVFLAGERAKGITGQAVVIDGGYTAQ